MEYWIKSAILFVSLGILGCATSGNVNHHLNTEDTAFAFATILNRATFESQCPKEEIALTVLDTKPGANFYATPTKISTYGCGKKLTYSKIQGCGWVLSPTH